MHLQGVQTQWCACVAAAQPAGTPAAARPAWRSLEAECVGLRAQLEAADGEGERLKEENLEAWRTKVRSADACPLGRVPFGGACTGCGRVRRRAGALGCVQHGRFL